MTGSQYNPGPDRTEAGRGGHKQAYVTAMVLNLQNYSRLRPMLYHGTATANLQSVRVQRALHSAEVLAPDCQHSERRTSEVVVVHDQHSITLRDQHALQEGHVDYVGGWRSNDLLSALSVRVFFWPGTGDGPNKYGRRLFDAYGLRCQAVLRVGLQDLLRINPDAQPYFCKFNSGAPRTRAGRRSPRGPDTFLKVENWPYAPWQVAEVSFIGSVSLPETTELWDDANGWQTL